MLTRYAMFAGYNAWCNERLYDATAKIDEDDYRADRGVFFKSLHGTLNHLLVGDQDLDAALHGPRRNTFEPRHHFV